MDTNIATSRNKNKGANKFSKYLIQWNKHKENHNQQAESQALAQSVSKVDYPHHKLLETLQDLEASPEKVPVYISS